MAHGERLLKSSIGLHLTILSIHRPESPGNILRDAGMIMCWTKYNSDFGSLDSLLTHVPMCGRFISEACFGLPEPLAA